MQNKHLQKQHKRRLRHDNQAAWFITFGGWIVLATLLVLLWHLLSVVLPMLKSPEGELRHSYTLQSNEEMLLATNILGSPGIITTDGSCALLFKQQDLSGAFTRQIGRIHANCSSLVKLKNFNRQAYLYRIDENGMFRAFLVKFEDGAPKLEQQYSWRLSQQMLNVVAWQVVQSKRRIGLAISDGFQWHVYWFNKDNAEYVEEHHFPATEHIVLMPNRQEALSISDTRMDVWSLNDGHGQTVEFTDSVEAAQALPNYQALLVATGDDKLEKWAVLNQSGKFIYKKIYEVNSEREFRTFVLHSTANVGLALVERKVIIFNRSTGEYLSEFSVPFEANVLGFVGNQLLVYSGQQIATYDLVNLSSSSTFSVLWRKQLYEGYAEPEYVWQTSSAEDYQETKFSLVPLFMGSVKAALLAILVAFPIGLGAAVYSAYYASQQMRKWLKPSIELLEAVPSVVIGFIAAIWILPLPEQFLLGFMLFLLLLPPVFILFSYVQRFFPIFDTWSQKPESQFVTVFTLLLLTVLSSYLVVSYGELTGFFNNVPSLFFSGEENQHSKNAIVVALALGIAIAPTIFSLAEDAIYEVPSSLKRGSYALGATRYQTLRNVVLVVAYPGILSAFILGFARALGETMIVLMVTGNTPIADWNFLAGMRTFTANLAIELPEAEVGSVHYQVLFLTALLLFGFTIIINTFAELMRVRLRKKYGQP